MAKLYTRKGDLGYTSLFGGKQVRKDDRRICTYGTIDELNAHLGVAVSLAQLRKTDAAVDRLCERLRLIQNELFSLGAELATPEDSEHSSAIIRTGGEQTSRLEGWIDEASDAVAPLKTFIIPGGDPLAAQLHVCRTVCRRAERCLTTLADNETINDHVPAYLNRLSDLLFAWARWVNHQTGQADVLWISNPAPESGIEPK